MSKNKIVFFIGVVLFIMPLFLGLPQNWENFIQIIFGITLIILSFSAAAKRRAGARRTRRIKEQEINKEEEDISQSNPNVTILPDISRSNTESKDTGVGNKPTI